MKVRIWREKQITHIDLALLGDAGPGALRRRDRTLDADRRDSANRAAARRELRRIAPPQPPRVGVGECLELGTRAQEEQAAVCGQVRAEPRSGEAAPQQASRPSGPGDGPQGWATDGNGPGLD